MKNIKSIFMILFTAINLLAVVSPFNAQNKKLISTKSSEPLFIEAKFENLEISLGEKVYLTITVKNNSKYTIELFDAIPEKGFDIELKNSKGMDISLTQEGKNKKYPNRMMGRDRITFLQSGKELSWKVDLSELYDISSSDDYSVSVKVKYYYVASTDKNYQNSGEPISSNTVKFKLKK